MEVSETKLVNFAEKTKFDVRSEFTFPQFQPSTQTAKAMSDTNSALVFPEIDTLLDSEGNWNGVEPVYRFSQLDADGKTQIYESFADIPGVEVSDELFLTADLAKYTTEKLMPALGNKSETQQLKVFELDPNQLLTISSGFKVILKRPRPG